MIIDYKIHKFVVSFAEHCAVSQDLGHQPVEVLGLLSLRVELGAERRNRATLEDFEIAECP